MFSFVMWLNSIKSFETKVIEFPKTILDWLQKYVTYISLEFSIREEDIYIEQIKRSMATSHALLRRL